MRKGFWNLPSWRRNVTEARWVLGYPNMESKVIIVWKLWYWSLYFIIDSSILKIPEQWDICQGRLEIWCGTTLKEISNFSQQSWMGLDIWRTLRHHTWSCRVWSLICWVLVLFRSSISSLCSNFYLFWKVMYILFYCMLQVWILVFNFDFSGDLSWVVANHESQRRLWTLQIVGTFEDRLNALLYCDMALYLWGAENIMWWL